MKLIFTLGNPELKYSKTRHNVGFAIADSLTGDFKLQAKFFAAVAETTINGEKLLIAKPTTYYNEVGRSLNAIRAFYKISDEDTLIIHDELALPLGTIRTRIGGSDAGNNGIKSINTHGGAATNRLRIGVRNELQGRMPDADFVLGNFSKVEQELLDNIILPKAHELISKFATGDHSADSHTLV